MREAAPVVLPGAGVVSAADLAAASRRRIAALSAGHAAAPSPFAVAPPAPAREAFDGGREEAPVFAGVQLSPVIPRSASAKPWSGGAALVAPSAEPPRPRPDSLAPRLGTVLPAIPRSASLFSTGSRASGRAGSDRHHRRRADEFYATTTAEHRHRVSGGALAPAQLRMHASQTFSESSSPFDAAVSPTPTGWSTLPVEPPKPVVVDPRKVKEEAKIKAAREQTHKLSPEDPNCRRRTSAVNLVDAFKEDQPAEVMPVARSIPRSESKRGGILGGGPGFRRNKSRRAPIDAQ